MKLQFNPHDLWIGVYWQRTNTSHPNYDLHVVWRYDIYVCLVPCFPIHFEFWCYSSTYTSDKAREWVENNRRN